MFKLTALAAVLAFSASALAQAPATTPPKEEPKTTPPATTPAAPADPKKDPAKPATPTTPPAETKKDEKKETFVYFKMATSMGDIVLELNNEKAPISTANFVKYAEKGYYDGTVFHRVMNNFMIQGGGFDKDLNQKITEKPIKNEWQNGLKNKKYTLAMARQGSPRPNPATVDSATSQFFINVKDNDFLDRPQADGGAYAVFGEVISGQDVVDKIKVVKTTIKKANVRAGETVIQDSMGDVPVDTVVITKVSKMTAEEGAKIKAANKK